MTRKWTTLILLACLAAACGPEEEAGTGFVEVSWKVANTTCSNAGIAEVELQLYQDEQRILTRTTACSDGVVTIPSVPVGTYNVRLIGVSADGDVLYKAEYEKLKVKKGDAPSSPPAALVLEQIKGTLELRWSFPAEMANCAFAGTSDVEININRESTGDSEFHGVYPCNLTADHPDVNENGYIEITGLPTDLDLEVIIFGLAPDSSRVLFGETVTKVPKLGSKQVILPLVECNGGCI
ncbi:MAG: carboxypeptidase-like regulatory domain-containing protein [Pseudomonadota bacterium]